MIHARVTDLSLTAIPVRVVEALGIKPGDMVGYEIDRGVVKLKKLSPADGLDDPLVEWADALDCVYDNL